MDVALAHPSPDERKWIRNRFHFSKRGRPFSISQSVLCSTVYVCFWCAATSCGRREGSSYGWVIRPSYYTSKCSAVLYRHRWTRTVVEYCRGHRESSAKVWVTRFVWRHGVCTISMASSPLVVPDTQPTCCCCAVHHRQPPIDR